MIGRWAKSLSPMVRRMVCPQPSERTTMQGKFEHLELEKLIIEARKGGHDALAELEHRAMRMAREGQGRRAEEILESLMTQFSQRSDLEALADTYFALGRILFFYGRYLDAASCFAAATEIQGKSTTTSEDQKQERCLSYRANHALAMAEAGFDSVEIAAKFAKYLGDDPDTKAQKLKGESLVNRDLHLLSLATLNYAAGHYPIARRYWERVCEDEDLGATQAAATPDKSHTLKGWRAGISLATIDIKQARFPDAEEKLKNMEKRRDDPEVKEAAHELDPASPAHLSVVWADLWIARKDWSQAEGHLRDALDESPYNVEAMYRLGKVLTSQEKYDEAESCLQRVVAASPWYAKAQSALRDLQLARQASKTGAQPAGLKSLTAGEWVVIGLCSALAIAIFGIGMSLVSSKNTVTEVTNGVNVSESGPTPVATCAPGAEGCTTGTQTKTTTTTAGRLHDVPSGLLAGAGALAAVAAVLLLSTRFSKIKIGPVDVEQPQPTSPAPVPSK
jgi:tetratricopeptide (TPR) repeat protein